MKDAELLERFQRSIRELQELESEFGGEADMEIAISQPLYYQMIRAFDEKYRGSSSSRDGFRTLEFMLPHGKCRILPKNNRRYHEPPRAMDIQGVEARWCEEIIGPSGTKKPKPEPSFADLLRKA